MAATPEGTENHLRLNESAEPQVLQNKTMNETLHLTKTAIPLRDDASTAKTAEKNTLQAEDAHDYPSGPRLAMISLGLALAVFCLGLDRSILATAIPKITNEFNSLDDVAWYGSSYLLTTCCFQLMFGKFYAEFKTTSIFLVALVLFELGSLVCAVARNSITLIIGRSIAGIGCAGLLSGALIILASAVPLQKRPIYTGAVGAISGIAQIIAPTLGGVFTDHATWRWCFWINLPLGAVTAAVVIFIKFPSHSKESHKFGIVSLVLGAVWGFIQWRRGDDATLPFRIIRQQSVAGGMWFTLSLTGAFFIVTYYVPIWFQSVRSATAEQSGINFLTATGGMTLSSVLAGIAASRIGYYVPQMLMSSLVTSIAAGLVYRYQLDTSTGYWVGSLIMFGIGVGLGIQMPLTAVQTVLKGKDISMGTSVIILMQTISGTIFLAVGQNLFQAKLVDELAITAPQVDPGVVISNGVSGIVALITKTYGPSMVTGVLEAYNAALKKCFQVCIILAAVSILGATFVEWKKVNADGIAQKGEADADKAI